MMAGDIHVGDTPLETLEIKDQKGNIVNINSATTMKLLFKRPDGSTFTRTAVHTTNGEDGLMEYQIVTADYDMPGWWRKEGYVVIGAN